MRRNWDSLNWLDFTVVDEERMMEFVDGKNANIPLVDIQVDCEFVSGTIRCGYFYTVPRGIDLILGNDIVTVEEPLEGSTEVEGSVENGIGAVNVRSMVVGTGVEIKKTDEVKTCADQVERFSLSTEEECLSELDFGDFGMFDESNESTRAVNDSVVYENLSDRESEGSYQMYDDEGNMVVNEGVLARLCDCEGCSERFEESIERTDVSNDYVSCLDLSDKQSEDISLRYDNECNKVVNEDNFTRLLADVNTNVGVDMLCECKVCDERFEMQSSESEWQHGIVGSLNETVDDVSCKQELEQMCVHVAFKELKEVVESPVEIVHKGVCINVEEEMFVDMVKSMLEALKWMLLRSISVRRFRLCCVDVCFGWKDDTLRMKGWLYEKLVNDDSQLQIDDFVIKLSENMLDVGGHVQTEEFVEKLDVYLWKDLNCVVEKQESLMLSSLNVTLETEVNDVSLVFRVVEQVHVKDKAVLSVESVMTTVVIANISSLSCEGCTSSKVALVCMDVDFGEKVVLVRKMVLLSNVVKEDDGSNDAVLNDVLIHVVTVMPCANVCRVEHEDLLNDDVSLKGEWMIKVYDDEDETLDCTVKMDDAKVDLKGSQMNNLHDDEDDGSISCDVKELSSDIVENFGNYDESQLCAQVYLQNVDSRNLLVGDEHGLRGNYTRRDSRNVSGFAFLWMVLTVVVLAARGTSVTSCIDSVWVKSMDCIEALDVVFDALAYSWYLGLVQLMLYFDFQLDFQLSCEARMNCDKLTKTSWFWSADVQKSYVNSRHRPKRLILLKDVVCRYDFGD